MKNKTNPKIICITIDVEPDFGGLAGSDNYFGITHLLKLKDIINKYDLKLTAFVTGKTLEDNPDVLDFLKSMNVEIEQHSYFHQVGHKSKNNDIQKGIETHKKILGTNPIGYRAPQGIITNSEAKLLEQMNIKYDSSIFPAFFPGRFNHLNFPKYPFIINGTNMMEIPFAVIPKIRIPIGLSYMQFLGFNTFKYLFKIFGIPSLLVYDLHPYELGKVKSYDKLPLKFKVGYYRSQKLYTDPFVVFEKFIQYILLKGYVSQFMSKVYYDMIGKVPTWQWKSEL